MWKFEEIMRSVEVLRSHCAEIENCEGCCLNTTRNTCLAGCPCIWNDEDIGVEKETVETETESTPVERRKRILDDAAQAVCSDRCKMYGEPGDNFAVVAELWNAYLNAGMSEGACKIDIGARGVADMMVLFKVGRASTAFDEHRDTYVDIAGYAACAGGMIKTDEGGGKDAGSDSE